ncbi:phage tail tube protein [Gimesia sp.]|uniref:phage tail tube protein n=1 Tax=Gimesia sp. TaxID=2024833 RepID=UPI003A957056
MSLATPEVGTFGLIAFDTTLPFDTSSIPIEIILPESLHEEAQILETNGMRGTVEHNKERTREGLKRSSGSIKIACSRIVLDALLPYICGTAESSNMFALADTIPEFMLMIDRGAKVYTYSGCRIAKANFNGSKGDFLYLDLDIEAETETTGDAGSFPVLTMPLEKPYLMSDGVLTLVSDTRAFEKFSLTIENKLNTEQFENNLTRYDISMIDRVITLATDHPWSTDNTDLLKQALDGAAGTAVFTNGAASGDVLTFDMAAIQYANVTPTHNAKDVTRLPLTGMVRSSGSTKPLIITNAHSA